MRRRSSVNSNSLIVARGLGEVCPEGVERLRDAHRRADSECPAALRDVARWLTERSRTQWLAHGADETSNRSER
jgi:hypothetical protein